MNWKSSHYYYRAAAAGISNLAQTDHISIALSNSHNAVPGQLLSFEKLSHSQTKTPHNCVKDKAFHSTLKWSKGSRCVAELHSIVSSCCHSHGSSLVTRDSKGISELLSYSPDHNKRPSSYPTWPDQAQWSGWTFRGHCARVSLQQPASVWVARPVSTGCPKKRSVVSNFELG